jgi:hypothetical protein
MQKEVKGGIFSVQYNLLVIQVLLTCRFGPVLGAEGPLLAITLLLLNSVSALADGIVFKYGDWRC